MADELHLRIVADDEATAKLQAFRRELQSGQTGLQSLATAAGVSGAAVTTALAGMAVAAFKLGEAWDDAGDKIRISTGATGEALNALQADMAAVLSTTPAGMAEVSGVVAELGRRGVAAGENLQQLAGTILDLSRLTGTDAVQNVRLATRAFGDWGIAVEDQVGALDKFLRASQATGVSVTTLQEHLVRFGAPLRQLGFDFNESIALLGKFEAEGVNAELVLGSLRIALGEMARQGVPAREGLQDVIAAIKGAGDASEATRLAIEIFGARAGPDMAAAIREGRLEIDALAASIRDGGETIQQAAADTDDGAQKFQVALNKIQVAMQPVTEGMFSFASATLESMSNAGAAIDTFLAGAGAAILNWRRQMAGFGSETGTPNMEGTAESQAQFASLMNGIINGAREAGEEAGEVLAEALGETAVAETEQAMAPWLQKLLEKGGEAGTRAGREAGFNLARALAEAGTDTAAIEQALTYSRQIQALDRAISQLTPTIAAQLVAMRNYAEATDDAGLMAQAAALAEQHLAAQVTTTTTAVRTQTAAVEALGAAMTVTATASRAGFGGGGFAGGGGGRGTGESALGTTGAAPVGGGSAQGPDVTIGNLTISAEQNTAAARAYAQAVQAATARGGAQGGGMGGGSLGEVNWGGLQVQWVRFGETVEGASAATKESTSATKANAAATRNVAEEQAATAAEWRQWTNQITATEALQQDAAEAARYATANMVQLTVGTGLASSSVSALAGNLEDLGRTTGDVVKAMQQEWTILQANAQALRAGSMLVGGINVGPGLTTSQIYGGTATGGGGRTGGGGGSSIPPGNYYGLPVVSPVTPGTLRGYDSRGDTVNVVINASGVDALRDDAFWEQAVAKQVRPALRRVGAAV